MHRSRTDSGIGFGLCQMMSWRRYQPSARNANASIHGIPTRSLCLIGVPSNVDAFLFEALPFWTNVPTLSPRAVSGVTLPSLNEA